MAESDINDRFTDTDGDGNTTAIRWAALGSALAKGSLRAFFLGLIAVFAAVTERTVSTAGEWATALGEFVSSLINPQVAVKTPSLIEGPVGASNTISVITLAANESADAIQANPLAFLFALVVVGVTLVVLAEGFDRL